MSPVLASAILLALVATPQERHSALLVTLDTTRADALSCYGNREPTTPVLDALAAEGLRFDAAHTAVPLTLPAHASMLTGLAPARHGVHLNGERALSGAARTLAERAQAAGIETAAFVSSATLAAAFGLEQGFERYSEPDPPRAARRGNLGERPARDTIDAALAWLGEHDAGRPFLLWVHLNDPHAPHVAPEGFAGRFATLYLDEVAAMDHELGRLLSALRARGLLRTTFVLVAGDHGEAFGEHGEEEHGLACHETTLRVPWIARWPDDDRRRGPGASDELVGVVDVAPTLAEALGLAPLEGLDGVSLYARAAPAGRGLAFESYQGFWTRDWAPLAGWIDARGKYVHGAEPELFDWRADPGESHDLAHERDLAPYLAALRAQLALPALASVEPGAGADPAAIAALGYAAGEPRADALPDPLAPSARPSPHAALRAGPR